VTTTVPAPLADAVRDESALRRFLYGLPGIDQVGLERRSAVLATRSIKKDAKLQAIDMAVSMIDLTTLEGADTPGKVRSLCVQAMRPDPDQPDVPPVAAICIYPDLVAAAVERLRGSGVKVAAVATAFPSGRTSLAVKLADVAVAVDAGADVIKTSTGKISPAATLPVVQVMLLAVRDWHRTTGEYRGVKPAGGIRTAKDAIRHLVAVNEVAGPAWLTPDLFRFGASSLLTDLLRQRRAQTEGHYASTRYIGSA